MKLTTKSEYALLALIYIGRHQSKDTYVKIEDICDTHDLRKKYLEQILTKLKTNQFIEAKRSALGGYRLATSPKKIPLVKIIRLMDGPLAPTKSVSKYFFNFTPLSQEPKVLKVFRDIRNYAVKVLQKTTLADLI